ncbi:hypothetical protein EXU85_11655 [Spirosoma sp. KCTC 42546]|uniref:hypothetical protein n=1 Tax=Spirosoma sp. KCTC 42546 TaxID=2520506 RepID=UPI00115A13AF|nr:hypothetical protein [Spirosoma sp. KCTC 42546]QDK79226.1 hypothetical protein EXU85_11655 [Spirosoma sp. KCTC 42546]
MKTKLLSVFALAMMLTVGAYAQDSTAMSKKEMRKQEKAERKARLKDDLKNTSRAAGETTREVGQGIKSKAKVAGEAIDTTAQRTGRAVNRGLDNASDAISTEARKLKDKRDSTRAEKARRDSL